MQEGSFRCDVNVSVRKKGSDKLGTRREIKNLNSFKFMHQSIEYETRWQIETLEDGGTIHQATVLFDPDTGETRAMRSKEEANDYRYFPDPDLLPLEVTDAYIEEVKRTMPELPQKMQSRFVKDYGFTPEMAYIITSERANAEHFDKFWKELLVLVKDDHQLAYQGANWAMMEIGTMLNRTGLSIVQVPITPKNLALWVSRILDKTLSHKMAKEVFEAMWAGEGDADTIIDKRGLKQISDSGAIEGIVDEVLAANASMV